MKIAEIVLRHRDSGEPVAAELFSGISDSDLRSWKRYWYPRLKRYGTEGDSSWDWRILNRLARSEPNFKSFTISCEGDVQGFLLIELNQKSRLSESAGKPLVYVSRVATAPWNRATFTNKPRYQGVGSVLILVAIEESFKAGCEGRLGLHSLPGAESFYARYGMSRLGIDPEHENLQYFEMSASLARDFRAKGLV